MTASIPEQAGVVGAGTMGAGIAQLAATAGMITRLHDPVPEALERGVNQIGEALKRQVAKGRLAEAEAAAIHGRIVPCPDLADFGDCGIAIEAAPEKLEIKRDLFSQIAGVVKPDCVLATNTSSLSISEIAATVPQPGRVVGLHFFNPVPVMRLVEVVAGNSSTPDAIAVARAVGEAMEKRVIEAPDIPGFIVNRCNRPFSLEPVRLLEGQIGTIEQIDRVARLAGGFRMGPFEFMDLVGLDTSQAIAEAFFRQTFGESRYRPSISQARLTASGRLGRKSATGWYEYRDGRPQRAPDPEPPPPGGGDGRSVCIYGTRPVAAELSERLRDVGFEVTDQGGTDQPWLVILCGEPPRDGLPGPRARLLADSSLHAADPEAAGFHILPPIAESKLVEITRTPRTDPVAFERLTETVRALGCVPEEVNDAPGLILGRLVAQLINEAAFLIGSGGATASDVDAGMELGVNHPHGPMAWCEFIGVDHVVSVLDALHRELGEERYRVAPLLRRAQALGCDEIRSIQR